ncbi:MAG: 5-(carboxyamino)imidazole ribonucleotide mutase [Methanobrevibacter wolinii]|uniref:5-(carboxyamino)imidazole ribonucleotide mutase n=1 Tax=Methanobrevibacter wolinii TaxID=190977 RepID=UPI0005B2E37F|nr:5-(carboxyamino)imidazole ribonucleotide mutase [Methanobrevibacter wolinii]MDD5960318.1 5-(carboxyamino)imidazole ribonucleotide mutase [Methanobrevibacter wolinii]
MNSPKVMIILGSGSDIKIAEKCMNKLDELKISYSLKISSAHRTYDKVKHDVLEGTKNGIEVFIGIAGMSAHLPGVIAAFTYRPVIGVPVEAKLDGLDALYSTIQMPFPAPVATVGIDRGDNAAILAAQIIGTYDEKVRENVHYVRLSYKNKVYTSQEDTIKDLDHEYLVKDFIPDDLEEIEYHHRTPDVEVLSEEECPDIAVIPGSHSDITIAKKLSTLLDRMKISYDLKVVSPIRHPKRFQEYIYKMQNVKLFIAINGLSSQISGSIVGLSEKPVIGVPCDKELSGKDSLLSMVSMPPGVPVGSVGINNGRNCAILAGEILAISNKDIEESLKRIKYKTANL